MKTSNLKRDRTDNHAKAMEMTRSMWREHLKKCERCSRFWNGLIDGKNGGKSYIRRCGSGYTDTSEFSTEKV